MKISRFTVAGAVVAALALAASAPALGAHTGVTVRVEGVKHTLLAATVAHPESGAITKGGTPAGSCPGRSAAGYFDNATHHRWSGTYSSGLGIEITNVLGERHVFSAKGYYWGIWVDNRFASAGLCDLKLKSGDQLLLAPAPGHGTTYPIVLSAPVHATSRKPFTVRTRYFKSAKGAARSLARVRVTHARAKTDKHGTTTITPTRAGKLKLVATLKGYIRAEATVTVAP